MIKITTLPQFLTNVVERSKESPTAVLFTSPTCAPCKELKPKLEATGRKVFVIDAGETRDLCVTLGVRAAPTLRIYKDGEILLAFVGDKPEALDAILEHIAPEAQN